jgi:sterol 14-demethylase
VPPFVSGARPLLGHAVEFLKSPETLLERGLAEHGRIFSLRLPGRAAVVMLGPEHSKFFFAETDKRLSIRSAYPFFFHMFGKETYFLAEPDEYQRQREIVLPRFQSRQMDHHLAVMERGVGDFIETLDDQGEFDLIEALGPMVMQIAAQCFLGADFNDRMKGFFQVFRTFSEGLDPLLPGWVPAPHLLRSHKARDQLRAAATATLKDRRENPLDEPDFLQELAGATYADGEPVPDSILVGLALMLLWVGHETTAGHLAWALIDLLQNPDELNRVRAEQRDLEEPPTPDQPLTLKQLHRMQHLDRALHETERLHPVTNGVVRRATEPIDYLDFRIPKGAIVLVHPGLSHRLPDVFPEPDAFRPDRFVEDPKGLQHLVGFGGGFHRCLGMHFAYVELKVAVTRLLQHFDFELVDENPQAAPGQKTKWPQSPCKVRYVRKALVPAEG